VTEIRKIQTQGVHHVTLTGADRQTSIDFWEGVLGMPFVFEQPNLDRPEESHLYFDPGDGRLITIFTNESRASDPSPCSQDTTSPRSTSPTRSNGSSNADNARCPMSARRPTLTATLDPTADGSNGRCLAVAHLDCEPLPPAGAVGDHVSTPVSGTVETSDEGDDRLGSKSVDPARVDVVGSVRIIEPVALTVWSFLPSSRQFFFLVANRVSAELRQSLSEAFGFPSAARSSIRSNRRSN